MGGENIRSSVCCHPPAGPAGAAADAASQLAAAAAAACGGIATALTEIPLVRKFSGYLLLPFLLLPYYMRTAAESTLAAAGACGPLVWPQKD